MVRRAVTMSSRGVGSAGGAMKLRALSVWSGVWFGMLVRVAMGNLLPAARRVYGMRLLSIVTGVCGGKSGGVDLGSRLVAAGGGSGVWGKRETVEDGRDGEDGDAEDGEVEVPKNGVGGRVAAEVGYGAKNEGSDSDAYAGAELHHGGEEGVGAGHALGGDLGVGEGAEAGELHGAERSVEEEDGGDEEGWGLRGEDGAEGDGDGGEDAVANEDAAEAEAAEDLNHDGLHAEVAGEEGEEVEAGGEGAEAEGYLEHEGEKEREDVYGDAEAAGSVDGEGVGLELEGFKVDEGGGGVAAGDGDGEGSAGEAEGEDGYGEVPVGGLAAELFHGEDNAGGGESGEEEGEPVEGVAFVGAGVFDPEESEDEGEDAEGQIEEEDPMPAGVGGDEAAEGRAED